LAGIIGEFHKKVWLRLTKAQSLPAGLWSRDSPVQLNTNEHYYERFLKIVAQLQLIVAALNLLARMDRDAVRLYFPRAS